MPTLLDDDDPEDKPTARRRPPRPGETMLKLITLIEQGKITLFDEDEHAALKEVAAFWIGFRTIGRMANTVRKTIVWVGWIVASYLAIKAGLVDWLKGIVR